MKGVKQVQTSIKLAHFSQKHWENNMIIDIKRKFHQQPHDQPRWIFLCTHEEADTMSFVHTSHATKARSPEEVLVAKTSDTEILFIAVSMTSQHWRWIPDHELCDSTGPQSRGIHAFTNHGIWCCIYLLRQRKEDVMYVMR